MPRARQYGFLRLDPRGDDYSDLYVPVEILQWFEVRFASGCIIYRGHFLCKQTGAPHRRD